MFVAKPLINDAYSDNHLGRKSRRMGTLLFPLPTKCQWPIIQPAFLLLSLHGREEARGDDCPARHILRDAAVVVCTQLPRAGDQQGPVHLPMQIRKGPANLPVHTCRRGQLCDRQLGSFS